MSRKKRRAAEQLQKLLEAARVKPEHYDQARAVFWCLVVAGIMVIVGVLIRWLS